MTLNEYQEQAMTTCMESSNNVAYMLLNLLGEVGELSEKVAEIIADKGEKKFLKKVIEQLKYHGDRAKFIRKNPDTLASDEHRHAFNRVRYANDEQRIALIKEIGDVMWQTNGLMQVLNLKAEDVAQQNLDKLADRQQRNQIDGEGDER